MVVGKKPEGLKIGVKRFTPKKPTSLTDELNTKSEDAWFLENAIINENDTIGICWDQTDLPMLSFYQNGTLLASSSITRIRPANDLYPAFSIVEGSTCDIIFDGSNFINKPPASRFKNIVCATSLL